jgi:hypothetical protein
MRSTQKPEDSSRRFARVLDRIRAGTDRLDLDDVGAWDEDERVRKLGLPVACQYGCTRVELVHCGWFLREMSKLMRRKDGPELELALELLVTKWVRRGLDRSLLQELICHCYTELCREGCNHGCTQMNTNGRQGKELSRVRPQGLNR